MLMLIKTDADVLELGLNGIWDSHHPNNCVKKECFVDLRILSYEICTESLPIAHALGSLQRVSVPPIPLASRFLPRLSYKCLQVAHWNGVFLDPIDRSLQSVVTIACGVRLLLSRIWFLFYSSPRRLSYAEDEAVDGTL